jgi:hypothetical protein
MSDYALRCLHAPRSIFGGRVSSSRFSSGHVTTRLSGRTMGRTGLGGVPWAMGRGAPRGACLDGPFRILFSLERPRRAYINVRDMPPHKISAIHPGPKEAAFTHAIPKTYGPLPRARDSVSEREPSGINVSYSAHHVAPGSRPTVPRSPCFAAQKPSQPQMPFAPVFCFFCAAGGLASRGFVSLAKTGLLAAGTSGSSSPFSS